MALTARQIQVLKSIEQNTKNGIPTASPGGPSSRPFRALHLLGHINGNGAGDVGYVITDKGRAELDRILGR